MAELTISQLEVVVRLLVTAGLCGAIGFERETHDQSAGFRTHILLGLGAALFTLVSAYGFAPFTQAAVESGGRGIQFDPTRIAAQIVTAVGFLGAGAIIRQGFDVRGLTTAASLWRRRRSAWPSGWVTTSGRRRLPSWSSSRSTCCASSARIIRRFRTNFAILNVAFSDAGGDVSGVAGLLERHGMEVRALDAELEEGRALYTIQLRIPPRQNVRDALQSSKNLPKTSSP